MPLLELRSARALLEGIAWVFVVMVMDRAGAGVSFAAIACFAWGSFLIMLGLMWVWEGW